LKYFIFAFLCIIYTSSFAQDELFPLETNPSIFESEKKLKTSGTNNYKINFTSIVLPFSDDFSTDKTVPKNLEPFVSGTFYSIGVCNNTLKYSKDSIKFSRQIAKKYSFVFGTPNQIDSSVLIPSESINIMDPSNCENTLSSYSIYPSFYRYNWNMTTGAKIDSTLIYDTTLVVSFVKNVNFKSEVLWVDNYAYINRQYAYLPPSLGVATLDGLNAKGRPYNVSVPNSWGRADYLTSVKIDLNGKRPLDSIYLSFFTQPQGFGDYPNPKDTLLVEFLDSMGTWHPVYRVLHAEARIKLDSNLKFKLHFIPIPEEIFPGDPFYFHSNFQFRFSNYASLTGNNDHWHIDYVRMDAGRNIFDTIVNDIAFQYDLPTILKNYTLLPAKQFRGIIDIRDSITAFNNNNNPTNSTLTTYKIECKNVNTNTFLYQSPTAIPFTPTYNFKMVSYPGTSYTIPTTLPDSTIITVKYFTGLSGLRTNDTAQIRQLFFNEIAYDDGSAEMAYGIQGNGIKKVAMKYKIPFQDTLAAIKIMFSNIDKDISSVIFNLNVWSSINEGNATEKIIKTIDNQKTHYIDTLNQFYVFGLDTPIIVKDSFYIGWTQTDENNLQIGYDRNSELGLPNTFIYTDNTWKKSNIILTGSPMIRAILDGTRDYRSKNTSSIVSQNQNKNVFETQLFPNPAVDFVVFESKSNTKIFFEIFDLNGKMVSKNDFKNEHKEDVSQFTKGIYLVKFFNDTFTETKKLIVK
jgi:hypothetical protein